MPTFQDNLYSEMDRVKNIWDDELTSLLDIEKIGHRKRILLSLAGREGILNRFGKVQVCIHNVFVASRKKGLHVHNDLILIAYLLKLCLNTREYILATNFL